MDFREFILVRMAPIFTRVPVIGRRSWSGVAMTKDKLQARTKKELEDMARKRGIAGWHGMRKEKLIDALATSPAATKSKPKKKSRPRARPQRTAARHTNGAVSAEEQAESSKHDDGVPTKNLSAK